MTVNESPNLSQRNRKGGSETDYSISVGKYKCLLPQSLNQYILTLLIKAPDQMPLHIQKEITHYNEMNNKRFNIDMNMLDVGCCKKCNKADYISSTPWTEGFNDLY
jgi:hypothetical protein